MPDQPSQAVTIRLRRSTLDALRAEALRRGVRVDEFAAEILRDTVQHDLYVAFLGR